ncbi:MAG: hypothetical protein E6Q83_05730 [Thiothrix sp.]|nr:MAG: hypothetical protein E6Q83_05730 [Thiothrix sp.]
MTYSNLQSFHRGLQLQNATALPADYYAALHNAHSVRSVSRYVLPALASIHPTVPTVADKVDIKALDLPLPQLPEKQISPAIDPESIPVIADRLRPSFTIDSVPVLEQSGKVIWKPGHGLIEKVDKLTGEIVHLSEK